MLVKNWMSKKLITADINDTMMDAVKLLKKHKILMLPVMKKGKLVGIVTDRDLKEGSASEATSLDIHELINLKNKTKVSEIMTRNPITVEPDYTVEETAEILLNNKISGAPVVDQKGELVGMITQTNILKALVSLAALSKKYILCLLAKTQIGMHEGGGRGYPEI
jgi:acetoin utilization protein AcuB